MYMGFTASNGGNGNGHAVQYLGTTKSNELDFNLSAQCPDTLVFTNKSVRNEFSDLKWIVQKGGTRLDSFTTYHANYKAPTLGTHKITLEALRSCDSSIVTKSGTVEAVDSVEAIFSYDVDTNCLEYKFRINTTCYNCDQMQWDFGSQKAAWGFPNQILNLTKSTDFKGYFKIDVRQGNCTDSDSAFFNLYILNTSAPALRLSTDTLCAGESLSIHDSITGFDSLVFTFSNGFGLGRKTGKDILVEPSGFGRMGIFRTIYYAKGCLYQDTTYIQVDTLPVAGILVKDSVKRCDEVEYSLNSISSFAEEVSWKLPNGKTSRNKQQTFAANSSAQQVFQLIARNGGCRDTTNWRTNPQIVSTPIVSFSADSTNGCSPHTAVFTWQTTDVDSYKIDFGNDSIVIGDDITNSWAMQYISGRYNVQYITYSGNNACIDTVTFDNYIVVNDSVVAALDF